MIKLFEEYTEEYGGARGALGPSGPKFSKKVIDDEELDDKVIDNQLDPYKEEDWDEKDISNVDIEDYLENNLKSDENNIFDNNDRLVSMKDVIDVVKSMFTDGTYDRGPM